MNAPSFVLDKARQFVEIERHGQAAAVLREAGVPHSHREVLKLRAQLAESKGRYLEASCLMLASEGAYS